MGGSAWTWFNTIVLNERLRGQPEEMYILHHELNHTKQFFALGWMWYPAQLFLDMDGYQGQEIHWDQPEENDARQWIPPAWFKSFHVLTLEFRLG
jgi:hypothetical protein